jgi:hypothetical protein
MQHGLEGCEIYTGFWSENMKERDHLEHLGVHGGGELY